MIFGFMKFEEVTKVLQKDSTTLAGARDMQDETVARYPELGPKFSATANIVHSVVFETAVYRVQCGDDSSMTECERAFVRSLLSKTHRPLEPLRP